MKNKEENKNIIGIFELNFIKEYAQKHNVKYDIYRNYIFPIINQFRIDDNKIERIEIIIQDKPLLIWRSNDIE